MNLSVSETTVATSCGTLSHFENLEDRNLAQALAALPRQESNEHPLMSICVSKVKQVKDEREGNCLLTRSFACLETVGQGSEIKSSGCLRTLLNTSLSLWPQKGGSPLNRM